MGESETARPGPENLQVEGVSHFHPVARSSREYLTYALYMTLRVRSDFGSTCSLHTHVFRCAATEERKNCTLKANSRLVDNS